MDLKDKVIIVTGASKGIGLQLCRQLLDKGAKVSGWSRSYPDVKHDNFMFCQTDMGDPDSVEESFDQTMEVFGGQIHALINNAGFGFFKRVEDTTIEDWEDLFAVNVHGIFYTLRVAVPQMRQQQYGHIINISSIAGREGINEATAYCGTKFAVRGISQALYKEVKKDNIKVTCIFPGSVDTHFFDNEPRTTANPSMLHAEDVARLIVQQLETPDNFNTNEIELRPMNVSYKG